MSVPGPPQLSIRPLATANQIEFWWAPPTYTVNQPAITYYNLACSSIGYSQNLSSNAFSSRVSSLTNNTSYQFTIAAANSNGLGPATAFRSIKPGNKHVTAAITGASMTTSTMATVTWSFTQNENESTNNGFTIVAQPLNPALSTLKFSSEPGTRSNPNISNLTTDTYLFRVYAVNDAGWQNISTTNVLQVKTQPYTYTPYVASQIKFTNISYSSFTASWQQGSGTSYNTFLLNNINTYPNLLTSTTAIFNNLSGATNYSFVINSVNNIATTPSYPQTVTTPAGPPGAITVSNTAGSPSASGFTVSWSGGTNASTFAVTVNGVTASTVANSITSLPVTNLLAGTFYKIFVIGTNSMGSTYSNGVNLRTSISLPSPPTNLYITAVTQTGFTVNWTLSAGALSYNISINSGTFAVAGTSNTTSYVVTGLVAGSANTIVVEAINNGSGPIGTNNSSKTSVTTFYTKPSAVSITGITSITETTALVNWLGGTGATSFAFFANGIKVGTASSGTSTTITGLPTGTVFNVFMIASNVAGCTSSSPCFSGMEVWLDAMDPGATYLNGATLTTWTDKSGRGNNATGSVTYNTNALSSIYPGVFFNGSQTLTGIVSIASPTYYIFAVYLMLSTGNGVSARLVSLGQTGQNDLTSASYLAFIRGQAAGAATGFVPNRNGVTTNANDPATYNQAYLTESWSDNTNIYALVQNGLATTLQATASSGPFTIANYALGSSVFTTATNQYYNGYLGEVLFFNQDLSTANRQLIEGYLSWKWAIQSNLPASPWFNSATNSYVQAHPSSQSLQAYGFLMTTIPNAPQTPRISLITESGFTVTWSASFGATGYSINIVKADASYNQTFTVGNVLTYLATGLASGSNYTITLRAINSTGTSISTSSTTTLTLPTAPTNLTVDTIVETGFIVRWTAAVGATSYDVKIGAFESGEFSTIVPGSSTTPLEGIFNNVTSNTFFQITGLTPGTIYTVIVQSINATGFSTTQVTTRVLTLSIAPSNLSFSQITENQFIATWIGALAATSYTMTVIDANNNNITIANPIASNTSYLVTGLTSGMVYTVSVKSINASGTSTTTVVATVLTLATAPASLAVSGAIGQTSFSVNWTASYGAANYLVTCGGFSAVTSSTSQLITGLLPGTQNVVVVRSINASGTSITQSTITVLTLPLAPVTVTSSQITETGAIINWVASTGAASYTLSISGNVSNVSVTGGTTYVATGLSPGTQYTVTIYTVNATGTSSNYSILYVLTLPASPTSLTPSAIGQTSFTMNWAASTGATSYYISCGVYNAYVSATSQVITGLQAGTLNTVMIQANNATGTSISISTLTVLTLSLAPPTLSASGIAETQFILNWTACTGAASYSLTISGTSINNASISGNTTYTATGLTGGTSYLATITSINASGTSTNNAQVTVVTLPTQQSVITTSSISQTGFTASWAATTGATSYSIQIGTAPSINITSTSYQATNLLSGTNYQVVLKALNATGSSITQSSTNVLTLPLAPTTLTSSAIVETGFTLNWAASTGASSYLLSIATSSITNVSISNNTLYTALGLNPGTLYTATIYAVNTTGTSTNSTVITILTLPTAPANLAAGTASITQTTIPITWTASTGATSYQVDCGTYSAVVTNPLSLITGLIPGTLNTITVRANNATGESITLSTITVLTLPLAPATITANTITDSGFILVWTFSTGATSYSVTIGSAAAVTVTGDTLYIATGLNSGTVHNISIKANNATGPSTDTATLTVLTLPAAPTGLTAATANITQTSCIVTWTASTGATVYNITVGTYNAVTASLTTTVTGLVAGTLNTVVIRALNASGTSLTAATLNVLTLPLAPTTLTTTSVGETTATVSWTPSIGAASYSVVIGSNAAVSVGNNTLYSVTGLTAGTTYSVTVTAINATGTSTNSTSTSFLTNSTAPSGLAVSNASITQSGFAATWVASTGATSYTVTAGDFSTTVTSPSATITGLPAGTNTSVVIKANNASGSSTTLTSLNVLTLPLAPTTIVASYITETAATLSWQPAVSATSYILSIVGTSMTNVLLTTTNYITTAILATGTQFTVYLQTVNATGTSPNTSIATFTTLPSAPTALVSSLITQTGFTLSWTAAVGAAQYHIICGYFDAVVTTTSLAIAGLTGGTANTAYIRSINVTGTSITQATTTVTLTPYAPATITANTITETTFILLWSPALGATSYILTISNSGVTNTVVTGNTSYSATGLTAGTTYNITLKSKNDPNSLTSTDTASFSVLTLATAPSGLTSSGIGQTSFTVSWSAATGASRYSVVSGNFSAVTTSTTMLVNGLLPGSSNVVVVKSINASGTSNSSTTITVLNIPAAPAGLIATNVTNNRFTLTWFPSLGAGWYNLTGTGGITGTFYGQNNTSYLVTGLTAATTYTVTMTAQNATGLSTDSSSYTVLTAPAAPTNIIQNYMLTSPTMLAIEWDGATGATSYLLGIDGYENSSASYSLSGQTAEFTGLDPGTDYQLVVTAVNDGGGTPSTPVTFTTAPDIPTGFYVTNGTNTSFTVNWSGGLSATSYTYELNGTTTTPSTDNGATYQNATFTGLTPNTTYAIIVTAENGGGSTTSNSFSTLTAPTTPTALTTSAKTSSGFTLGWSGGNGATSYIYTFNGAQAIPTTDNGVSSKSAVFSGLSGGTAYSIVVIAINSGGNSASTSSSVTTGPSKPINLQSSLVSDTGLTVSWEGGTGATGYTYTLNGSPTTPSVDGGLSGQTATFTGLTANTPYTVIVIPTAGGVTTPSDGFIVTTAPGAPVLATSATNVTETGMTVNWTGGAGATSFGYSFNGTNLTPTTSTSSSATFTNLTGNTPYTVIVTAVGPSGSTLSTSKTYTTAPVKPVLPVMSSALTITETSITITWTAGTGATSYVYSLNGTTTTASTDNGVSSKTATFTALTGNTPYTLIVTAVNVNGSTASASQIYTTAPVKPVLPAMSSALAITETSITITWTGGNGATSYIYSVNGTTTTPSTDNGVSGKSATFTALTGNTPYTIIVTAANANDSTVSESQTYTTAPVKPVLPVMSSALAITETSITITWTGGNGATSYIYSVNGTTTTASTDNGVSSKTATFTALTGNAPYTIIVTAANATHSTASTSQTYTTAPVKPVLPVMSSALAITETSITITWTGGNGATSYIYSVNGTTTTPSTDNGVSSKTATFTALTGNTSYTIIVTAANANDSTASASQTYTTAPVKPVINSTPVTSTQTSITISWTGGTGASTYSFTLNGVTTAPFELITASSQARFTGLSADTSYTFIATATNTYSDSTSSEGVTIGTLINAPTAPSLSSASITATGFTVNWSGATGATSYSYAISPSAGSFTASPSGTSGSVVWTGLTGSTNYTVTVTAINSSGSTPSSGLSVTTATPSDPNEVATLAGQVGTPGRIDGTGTSAAFTLNWAGSVDPVSGNLYVSDYGEYSNQPNAIRQVTPSGVVTTFYSESRSTFVSPMGSVVYNGALYVVSTPYIYRIDLTSSAKTTFATYIGSTPSNSLGSYIDVDSAGNFYVTSYGAGGIYKVTSGGSSSLFISTGSVYGIAVDSPTSIYYTSADAGTIMKYNGSSSSVLVSGLTFPVGLTLSQDKTKLYCAVSNHNTILEITTATGASTVLAGTTGSPGSTNGTRAQSKFNQPYDVKLAKGGTFLYVMDQGNLVVRTVQLP